MTLTCTVTIWAIMSVKGLKTVLLEHREELASVVVGENPLADVRINGQPAFPE